MPMGFLPCNPRDTCAPARSRAIRSASFHSSLPLPLFRHQGGPHRRTARGGRRSNPLSEPGASRLRDRLRCQMRRLRLDHHPIAALIIGTMMSASTKTGGYAGMPAQCPISGVTRRATAVNVRFTAFDRIPSVLSAGRALSVDSTYLIHAAGQRLARVR